MSKIWIDNTNKVIILVVLLFSYDIQGGSKVQEAYYIFQDFCDKYVQTALLLNGKAVCCMQMGRFEEAETALLEALNKVSRTIPIFKIPSFGSNVRS